MAKLIIFDIDGTIAEAFKLKLMPGVQDFFRRYFQDGCGERLKIAIATNQGGVGIRYAMEQGSYGRPARYPTEASIEERIKKLIAAIGGQKDLPVYVSYRYRNRQGEWTPVPPGKEEDPRWLPEWRKPSPGMLLQAIKDAGVSPENTLFIGDSTDDLEAARAAGCAFAWAKDFFARQWGDCESLEDDIEQLRNGSVR